VSQGSPANNTKLTSKSKAKQNATKQKRYLHVSSCSNTAKNEFISYVSELNSTSTDPMNENAMHAVCKMPMKNAQQFI